MDLFLILLLLFIFMDFWLFLLLLLKYAIKPCFFGFHEYKTTTIRYEKHGTIKKYFKCTVCSKKKMYQWNPNARHACGCGSGREEGKCYCNSC